MADQAPAENQAAENQAPAEPSKSALKKAEKQKKMVRLSESSQDVDRGLGKAHLH